MRIVGCRHFEGIQNGAVRPPRGAPFRYLWRKSMRVQLGLDGLRAETGPPPQCPQLQGLLWTTPFPAPPLDPARPPAPALPRSAVATGSKMASAVRNMNTVSRGVSTPSGRASGSVAPRAAPVRAPNSVDRALLTPSRSSVTPHAYAAFKSVHHERSGAPSRKVERASRIVCQAAPGGEYRSKAPKDIRVLVVGPTGYIGKFVVKELIKRGYNVTAFARETAGIKGKMGKEDTIKAGINGEMGKEDTIKEFPGATVKFGNVMDKESISKVAFDDKATKNVLDVAREKGGSHFVLLSAICAQKPLLEFQRAKLKFESDLQAAGAAGEITYSIVRPTAFFKSLAGQIELVKAGKPYVMFGDGTLASCKPISESDLASFISDCVVEEDKVNKMLPIGGPGKAMSARDQANMLFKITGNKENFFPVPVALMDGLIGIFDALAKIGKYYAVESMLVWDPVRNVYDEAATPSYGKDTLEAFFTKAVKEGLAGQDLGDQAVFGVGAETGNKKDDRDVEDSDWGYKCQSDELTSTEEVRGTRNGGYVPALGHKGGACRLVTDGTLGGSTKMAL
eukprot:gene2051-18229_t